ncbi:betaine/carnitine transporter, BCCT family [Dethiosulfatibacter aminovorans DSM 17477]|uniref:Betaine/carnitine transporter, BCCT family n=1 Tax=Dethiosulfatibacter aminovorans DSM 17477 TaxID=1121476 RepID=A0A1M6M4L0_9FIRM|nr:BCCT family transporter [Dethiosulfatibacter aminovorans]SHJ78415.1 betaine/carnitine transporter, BCCT family [Dethiosulfatibacter aminovorans DSM 17477]
MKTINKPLAIFAIVLLIVVIIPIAVAPEASTDFINGLLGGITGNFGWLFLLAGIGSFGFLMYCAFSKYGDIKFGGPDSKPDYSTFSWVSMLLCAGLGSSIMIWGGVEWMYYVSGPPFRVAPYTLEAYEWASAYGMYHWGFVAWAMFAIPTVPIAYSYWVKKNSSLKMSSACNAVIGDEKDSWTRRIIDAFIIFGILGSYATTIGLGTPIVSRILNHLFGIQDSFFLRVSILVVLCAVFTLSVYKGIESGIQVISRWNVKIALGLFAFIFIVGPKAFMLDTFVQAVGMNLSHVIDMSFYTDSIGKSGFPQGWTIFYWAWWIAMAPFMGLWVARISKGRTIRELVIAECFWGSMGCWLSFNTLGSFGMNLELEGTVKLSQVLAESGKGEAIITMLQNLPLSYIVIFVYGLLLFLNLVTSCDSTAYVLAQTASKNLKPGDDPNKYYRVFWAMSLVIIPIALMSLEYKIEGLDTMAPLQIASVVSCLPVLVVLGLMIASFIKWIKEDIANGTLPIDEKHRSRWPELEYNNKKSKSATS